jgi:hypothetical protein
MKTLGNYQLLAELGKGGMGNVYLALHKGIGGFEKKVAIKSILPHVADDAEFIRMLVDEARLTVQLTHPNIVQIIDLASEGDIHYVVMEYVEGVDLHRLAEHANPPLALDEAAHIIAEAAHALAYAHRKCGADGKPMDIVHRDISAHNLLVTSEGNTKVLDFGIAKAASNRVTTQIGVLKGKLAYMSPEQALGKPLDGRSDLFSLGIVMWELVTGKRLFSGHTDIQTLLRVQKCEVEPPSRLIAGFPHVLEEIVLRCLAREPAERYADGDRLADDLHEFMRSHQGAIHPRVRLARRVAEMVAAQPPRLVADANPAAPAAQTLMNASARTTQLPLGSLNAEIPMGKRPMARRFRIALAAVSVITALGLMGSGGFFLAKRSQPVGKQPHAIAATSIPSRPPESVQAPSAKSAKPVSVVSSGNIQPSAPALDIPLPPKDSASFESSAMTKRTPLDEPAPTPIRADPKQEIGAGVKASNGKQDVRDVAKAPAESVRQPGPKDAPVSPSAKAAPKSATKPEPKKAVAGNGFLSLNAVPWARVYINGKSVADSTPLLRHELPPGEYTIVLVNPDLRARKELKIEIQSGEHLRRSINLP